MVSVIPHDDLRSTPVLGSTDAGVSVAVGLTDVHVIDGLETADVDVESVTALSVQGGRQCIHSSV